MEAKRQDLMNSIGLLVVRVGIAGYMTTHGWGKVSKVLSGDFKFADPIGLGEGFSLVMAAGAEFGCALLVLIGLGTRFAAAPVVFTMIVAAFVVHAGDPWTMSGGASKEPALIFAAAFLALIFTGAGRFSVDGMIWPMLKERRARQRAAGK